MHQGLVPAPSDFIELIMIISRNAGQTCMHTRLVFVRRPGAICFTHAHDVLTNSWESRSSMV